MNFYLAAPLSRRAEIRHYRNDLENLNHKVTSRWLDSDDSYETATSDTHIFWAGCDFVDVYSADALILFSDSDKHTSRGGKHVEFGMALALQKQLYICGKPENTFHYFHHITIRPNWAEMLKEITYWTLQKRN